MTELGNKLRERRTKLGLTLREVERRTGIPNAHLSQIESGNIRKPDPNILWELSRLYRFNLQSLMRLAGHTQKASPGGGRLTGVAYRAIGELSPEQQRAVLKYIDQLREAEATEKHSDE